MAKQLKQSRTVKYAAIMAGISTVFGLFSMYKPFLSQETYVLIYTVLGVLNAAGTVYMRSITSEPISR